MTTRYIGVLTLALAGCATVGETALTAGTTGQIRFQPEDVDAAIVIARQSKDPVAEACFAAIRKHLDVEPNHVVVGIVSAYAHGRAAVRAARAPLAEDVHLNCAPLIVDAASFAARLGATFGR